MSVLIIYIHIILLYIKYMCTYIYINTHMNSLVPEMSEMCEMLLQSTAI